MPPLVTFCTALPDWIQGAGSALGHALLITGFVFVMMLLIEYINVLTHGRWQEHLSRWTWGQPIFAALLGLIPGCLGAYAVTSLYMHRVVTLGSVVAAMIATSGDEAFVMLATMPGKTLWIMGALLGIGVLSGLAVDTLLGRRKTRQTEHTEHYHPSHPDVPSCVPLSRTCLLRQWRHCSRYRAGLLLMLALFTAGALSGRLGHQHTVSLTETALDRVETPGEYIHEALGTGHHDDHGDERHQGKWDWIRITLLLAGLIGLLIVATVPDHFLNEHLWNHLFRVHVWRIFLWTFGALLLVHLLGSWLDLSDLSGRHAWTLLAVACLLGLIPESGPHLVFVALYLQGTLPLSVLLASSIVQDGHGMIPMLAHSRGAFLAVKAVNLAVGLAVGAALLAAGF